RAELLYQQLDGLQALRRTLRPELLAESRKHKAAKLLRQIPCIGPIRAARLIALMQTVTRQTRRIISRTMDKGLGRQSRPQCCDCCHGEQAGPDQLGGVIERRKLSPDACCCACQRDEVT